MNTNYKNNHPTTQTERPTMLDTTTNTNTTNTPAPQLKQMGEIFRESVQTLDNETPTADIVTRTALRNETDPNAFRQALDADNSDGGAFGPRISVLPSDLRGVINDVFGAWCAADTLKEQALRTMANNNIDGETRARTLFGLIVDACEDFTQKLEIGAVWQINRILELPEPHTT